MQFRSKSALFLVFVINVVFADFLFSQEGNSKSLENSKQDEKADWREIEVTLERVGDGQFRANTDVGLLVAGAKNPIKLSIVNPFDEAIQFDDVELSGSCTDVEFDSKSIPARAKVSGKLVFSAPDFASKGKVDFSLSFQKGVAGPKGRIISVVLNGTLAGVIDIGETRRLFEVPNGMSEFSIPIFFTKPVEFESLDVSVSSELRDIIASLESVKEGQVNLKLTIPKSALPDRGIAGEVQLRYLPKDESKSIYIVFVPQLPYKFSPTVLYFRKRKGDEKLADSGFILQFSPEGNVTNEPEGQKNDVVPELELRAGESILKTKLMKMSSTIWRIEVVGASIDDLLSAEAINGVIDISGNKSEFQLQFLILEK